MTLKRSMFLAVALCAALGCGDNSSSDGDDSSDESADDSDESSTGKKDAGKDTGKKDASKDTGKKDAGSSSDDDEDTDDEGTDDEGTDDEDTDDDGKADAGKADAGKTDAGKTDAGGGGGGDCEDLTYEAFGKPFLDKYCASCHAANSKDREDAPKNAIYDTLDQVKKAKVALGVYVVTGKLMPPKSYKSQPTADERAQFQAWLDCGPN